MYNKFKQEIDGWSSWGNLFQSISVFEPLVRFICDREGLAFSELQNCKPGTNAVFRMDKLIVKIFAPDESGYCSEGDYYTELFGIKRANFLGISAPKLVASGCVRDRYLFRYLIMECINAQELGDIENRLTYDEKYAIGRKLREITDKMNTPCERSDGERFNNIDIIERELVNKRWDIMPESFNRERIEYLRGLKLDDSVYVHGDLNPDNILINSGLELFVIDFADAVYAPVYYEHATVAAVLFCFEKPYMMGFFGDYDTADIAKIVFKGLIIHDFGAGTIKANLDDKIYSLDELKERLYLLIKQERERESL